jgi:hypothetical protein
MLTDFMFVARDLITKMKLRGNTTSPKNNQIQ